MPPTYLDIRSLRAFLLTVDTGSVTEASRRMGRTQSAITQQIQKLEEILDAKLFDDTRRTLELTETGTILLSHARQILRQHDACVAQLVTRKADETVVFGVPDLYAAFILPPVLSAFRRIHPEIRIELCCALSRPLVARVREGSVDIALVTRMDGFTGGQVVGREQLVWLTGATSSAHLEKPLPVALLPPGNVYRDYAIDALDKAGLDWRISCVSDSVSGLQTAVLSGLATTVLIESALVPGLRCPPPSAGLPPLPTVDLLLYRAASERRSPAVDELYEYLLNYLTLSSRVGRTTDGDGVSVVPSPAAAL
ncbi:MAG: LysR family transcriptional regulator [Pseudomonadota bacterium]|jgi:DNA-binding transcriptional LysR family regulator